MGDLKKVLGSYGVTRFRYNYYSRQPPRILLNTIWAKTYHRERRVALSNRPQLIPFPHQNPTIIGAVQRSLR
jgi:hypothetical protein